jgi:hypothetical protein
MLPLVPDPALCNTFVGCLNGQDGQSRQVYSASFQGIILFMSAAAVMMQKRKYGIPVKKSGEQVLYTALVNSCGADRGDSIFFMSYTNSVLNVVVALCSQRDQHKSQSIYKQQSIRTLQYQTVLE